MYSDLREFLDELERTEELVTRKGSHEQKRFSIRNIFDDIEYRCLRNGLSAQTG